MSVSQIISNAFPSTAWGAVIGIPTGIAIMASLDKWTDDGPRWDQRMVFVPYDASRAVAPYVIVVFGGLAGGTVGAVAGCVYSVAQQIL